MNQSKNDEISTAIFARWGCSASTVEGDDQMGKILAISLGLGCLFNEDEEAERQWMQTPHNVLKTRPITMILAGNVDEVLQQVNRERNL